MNQLNIVSYYIVKYIEGTMIKYQYNKHDHAIKELSSI